MLAERKCGKLKCLLAAFSLMCLISSSLILLSTESALSQTNSTKKDFPTECQGFLQTQKTRLINVWGNYGLQPSKWILSVAFSPDGKLVLSGAGVPGQGPSKGLEGGELKLWDVASGKGLQMFKGHTRQVISVTFSPDAKLALSGSYDGTVKLWDISNSKEIRTLKNLEGKVEFPIVDSVAFSPDGKFVLVGTSENPSLRLLEVATGKEIQVFKEEFSVRNLAFSSDGKFAFSVSSYDPPKLWDVASGREIRRFMLQSGILRYLLSFRGAWTGGALSPDGKSVLAGNSDSIIRLWDAATGKEIRVFKGHKGRISSVAFSPNGKFVVSVSNEDNTVRLWDVASGTELDQIDLSRSKDKGYCVVFSPDGRSFLVGTHRGVILHFALLEAEKHRGSK